MSQRIYIFDTTLRDGEQAPGFSMNIDEKIKMALQLEKLGVDVIEAGFPIASEGDFEAVKEIAQRITGCTVAGLCRTKPLDIDRAWEALKYTKRPRIHTFIATSDIHLKYKLKKTREEALDDAVAAVRYAKSLTADVEFSAEDASRSELDFLCRVLTAVIDAGATVVNIPDTVGYAVPTEFGALIQRVRQKVPNIQRAILSVHCHNDLGLAVANSLAGIENGAQQVECTINGIGERAGNCSLEEIVMALRTRFAHFQAATGVRTQEIYRTSQLLSNITGVPVQPNKAIVGKNAFAHEAGIHQDGVLKNPLTYEIMTPQSVGIPSNAIVLGKHSGRHALAKRYEELGYVLSKDELEKAYHLFCKLADQKKQVFDEDLIAIANDEIHGVPETYTLENLQVHDGTHVIPTATVALCTKGEVRRDSATGDGPVDAAFRAIDRITQYPGRLLEYAIRSVTGGRDAVGEVFVKVSFDGQVFMGKAASTDILQGSVHAYLHAVNRALYARDRKLKSAPWTSEGFGRKSQV